MDFEGKDEEFVVDWLRRKGFKKAVVAAFKGNILSYIATVYSRCCCGSQRIARLAIQAIDHRLHRIVQETIIVKKFALATGITK